MEIRTLRYVVTLSEELHFGRAAQRHHISQQPFGQHIRRVEREAGVELFERTSRRVRLTPAGARFVADARRLLADADRLAEHAGAEIHGAGDDTLVLGVLGFGAAGRWRLLRHALEVQLPGLRIDHVDLDLTTQHRAVLHRVVDAGIAQHIAPVDGLRFDVIFSSPRVAVVPAWSELADAPWLSSHDVAGASWLGLPDASAQLLDWAGPEVDLAQHAPAVRQPAAVPAAVATSGRIALHAAAAGEFYPHPDVRFVPLEGPPVEIALITRVDDDRPMIAALRSAARFARGDATEA